ncbi:hypothetical protein [Mycolicibacterium sp. XJ1819]
MSSVTRPRQAARAAVDQSIFGEPLGVGEREAQDRYFASVARQRWESEGGALGRQLLEPVGEQR